MKISKILYRLFLPYQRIFVMLIISTFSISYLSCSRQNGLQMERPNTRETLKGVVAIGNIYASDSPLHIAVFKNDINRVRDLMLEGADIDAMSKDGLTPLCMALHFEYDNIADVLIRNGAQVDILGCAGQAALHIAVRNNNLEIISLLLEKGTDANLPDKEGHTPLYIVIDENSNLNNLKIISLLLENGADVNLGDNGGHTPLHLAVVKNNLEIMSLLLRKGAEANLQDEKGHTPLYWALKLGHLPIAKLLITRHRVNVSTPDKNGLTPLYIAIAKCFPEDIVALLINYGAQLDIILDDVGNTVLHYAAQRNWLDVAKLLIRKKVKLDGLNNSCQAPLHHAAGLGFVKIAELLINNGATLDILDDHQATPLRYAAACQAPPLHCATDEDRLDMISLLIGGGAKLDIPDIDGSTPLHGAANTGRLPIAKLLINKGANVNARNKEDNTPLHVAVARNNVPIIKALLSHPDIKREARNKAQKTPLDLAKEKNYTEIIALFKPLTPDQPKARKNSSLELVSSTVDLIKSGKSLAELDALWVQYADDRKNNKKIDINAPLENGDPLWHWLVKNKQIEWLDKLLKLAQHHGFKPNLNVEDKKGLTPLQLAVQSKDHEIVRQFVNNTQTQGTKVNTEMLDSAGLTLLQMAIYQEGHPTALNEAMIEILLTYQPALLHYCNEKGDPALHWAIKEGYHLAILSLLQAAPAHGQDIIEKLNKAGATALQLAIEKGDEKAVEILLSYVEQNGIRLSTDIHNSQGDGFLHKAVRAGNPNVVKQLLDFFFRDNPTYHVFSLLNAINKQRERPLSIALRKKDRAMVDTLLEFAHSTNILVITGNSALTGGDTYCEPLLHVAIKSQESAMVKALLDFCGKRTEKHYKEVIEENDRNGNNALHKLLKQETINYDMLTKYIIPFIKDYGVQAAAIDKRNKAGQSLQDIAQAYKHMKALKLLEENGLLKKTS